MADRRILVQRAAHASNAEIRRPTKEFQKALITDWKRRIKKTSEEVEVMMTV